jgi:hypothetical protein
MVTVLSALTKLEELELQVHVLQSHPGLENQRLPLLTRTALPSLTVLRLRGTPENVQDFIERIDAPLLDHLYMDFHFSSLWNRFMIHDPRHILQFISRIPKLQAPDGYRS